MQPVEMSRIGEPSEIRAKTWHIAELYWATLPSLRAAAVFVRVNSERILLKPVGLSKGVADLEETL